MRAIAWSLLSLGLLVGCSGAVSNSKSPLSTSIRTYYIDDLIDPPGYVWTGCMTPQVRAGRVSDIADLLSECISPQSWRDVHTPGMPAGVALHNSSPRADGSIVADGKLGTLVVTANEPIQKEIRALLAILRQDLGLNVVLETQCFLVGEDTLKDMKVPETFTLLDPPNAPEVIKALTQRQGVTAISSSKITMHSGISVAFQPGGDNAMVIDLGNRRFPNQPTYGVSDAPKDLVLSPSTHGVFDAPKDLGFPMELTAAVSGDRKYVLVTVNGLPDPYDKPRFSIPDGGTVLLAPIRRHLPDRANPNLGNQPILLVFVHPVVRVASPIAAAPATRPSGERPALTRATYDLRFILSSWDDSNKSAVWAQAQMQRQIRQMHEAIDLITTFTGKSADGRTTWKAINYPSVPWAGGPAAIVHSDTPGQGEISALNSTLVVTQTPEVQAQVAKFLEMLKINGGIVATESRLLGASSEPLAQPPLAQSGN